MNSTLEKRKKRAEEPFLGAPAAANSQLSFGNPLPAFVESDWRLLLRSPTDNSSGKKRNS
jgi:hypothetical protein